MLGLTDLKISLYTTTKGGFGGTALSLDFLSGTLDPRITFSRGTNATLIDSTGRLTYAPANMLLNSEGTVAQLNASGNVTDAAPTISGFANSIQFGDNSVARFAYKTLTLSANVALVASFFVQMDDNSAPVVGTGVTGGDLAIIIDGSYAPTVNVSLVSGSIYRVWGLLAAPTGGGFRNVGIIKNTGQSTKGFRVTGFQLEQVTYQTTPSTYVATTTSAYYGPRFDYDPVTLAPRGLLIEEARTNLLTYSEQFDNAAWTKGGSTVTANVTASPDGTTNADKLAEDATTGTHGTTSAVVSKSAVATTYTYTIYVKAAERSAIQMRIADAAVSANRVICDANLSAQTVAASVGGTFTNASATITVAGNGWFRVSLTGTTSTETSIFCIAFVANPTGTISYAGTAGSGVFLYGAQLEAGAFATSYIPTVASTVSRSADVATMTGTNFSSWYNQSEGTFAAVYDQIAAASTQVKALAIASDGTSNNRVYGYVSGSAGPTLLVTNGGVAQANPNNAAIASGPVIRSAFCYKVNDFAIVTDGGAASTDTLGTVPSTADRLDIGCFGTGTQANGHIRAIAYYNTRLPNTQLQTLTAPSLAAPLALDFLSTTYTVGY